MSDHQALQPDQQAILDPNHELISSARVEGTPVYGSDGRKLGTIHCVMIHKVTGQVAHAMLAFGGFLHFGESVRAIPWSRLAYDTGRHGYVLDLTREEIEAAPKIRMAETDRLDRTGPSTPFI